MDINGRRQMTFARALFDNVAEMPRELSFKKGDILTVLQEKYENNPEWWVCSLRNMVGLAPANRLEAMPVLIQNKPGFQSQMSASTYDELPEQVPQDLCYFNISKTKTTLSNDDTYSTYQMPNEDIYVNPITSNSGYSANTDEHSVYQIPVEDNVDDTYSNTLNSDLPYINTRQDNILTPLSSKESTNEYYNNRYDYSDSFSDATSTSFTESSIHSMNPCSLTSSDSGDFKSILKDNSKLIDMTPENALIKYRQIQSETTSSCNKVIEFVKAKWKSEDVLRLTVHSIRQTFFEFNDSLNILINFAIGVYQNSLNCGDVNLTKKLGKHVSPLQESKQTVKDALEKLGNMNWDPEKIATSVRLAVREGADSLGQVVSSARNVLINIRSLSVTISGNSTILFTTTEDDSRQFDDESCSLQTTVKRKRSEDATKMLNVLKLFAQQVQSQVELINETVDDFINLLSSKSHDNHFKETVTSNSKFVVRSATQLVCIAKNLSDTQIKSVPCDKIEEAGNRLCDSLKSMINVTKQFISEKKWSKEHKEQLLGQLKAVKINARSVQSIVVNSVS